METKNLKVIYKILNIITNDFYIGSTNNHIKRFAEHKRQLLKNIHHNIILQNSYNKYGINSFQYEIIEFVENQNDLLNREQYYLDLLKPTFNIAISSSAPMLGKKHKPETIKKLLEDLKNRPTGKEHPLHGIKWSEDRKKIWSVRRKELKMKHSTETKQKMSETGKRLNRYSSLKPAIEKLKKKILDSNGNIFNSLTEAASFHDISIPTVCDILKCRHQQTRKKVKFFYYD
jgi:group I intron endonuclease